MPFYRCTVLNSFGEKQKVTREASDEISLKAELRQDKIHLLRYHVIREKKKNEFLRIYNTSSGKINPLLLKKYITYLDWFELVKLNYEIIYKRGCYEN